MFSIEESTIREVQKAFDEGESSSFELVAQYFERIADFDKSGPKLNSVLEINPEALHIAEAMDRERALKGCRGLLHGIPIMVKDSINTNDKMHTSAGSLALADNYATYDATIVRKLREAGAVIMGKTNMTEFAYYMTKKMKSGYSARGGQTLCPYNPECDPWGSSTGSAVAVSANFCMAALGTETNGSIIWPSHNNGVVGIKPTFGSVSRHGIIPICTAQDIAGPIARTVEDAAILLGAIAGHDSNDPSTWSRDGAVYSDYQYFLNEEGLKEVRVGINRASYDELTKEQIELAEQAFSLFEKCGAIAVDGADLPRLRSDREILFFEFKQSINAYLSTCHPSLKVRTLEDVVTFNKEHSEVALKYGQDTLERVLTETSGTLTEPQYLKKRATYSKQARDRGIDWVMNRNNVDILVTPGLTDLAAISGYPAVVIPVGYVSNGMPLGLTFTGRAFSEPTLLAAAYAFEQASKARVAPKLS